MSDKTKFIGIGAILSPLIIFILVGSIGVVGTWASKVPELETTVKLEFIHINKNIDKLAVAQTKNTASLTRFTEKAVENNSRLTEAILLNTAYIYELRSKGI